MKPYFAYGSNLNADDLRRWCNENKRPYPLGEFQGLAFLPDVALAFNAYSRSRQGGVCSPFEAIGQVLPGALFEVPPALEDVLDAKEGAPNFYEKVETVALLDDGRSIPCFTYRIRKKHQEQFVRPHDDYVQIVATGLHSVGQTADHLAASAEGLAPKSLVRLLFCYGTLMSGVK